jgi:hypothetical protein
MTGRISFRSTRNKNLIDRKGFLPVDEVYKILVDRRNPFQSMRMLYTNSFRSMRFLFLVDQKEILLVMGARTPKPPQA